MDFTSRMAALLGAFRRERNGAVADSMRLYGKPYGLNYGVSLPTLRTLARARDHRPRFRQIPLAAGCPLPAARGVPYRRSGAPLRQGFAFWGDGLPQFRNRCGGRLRAVEPHRGVPRAVRGVDCARCRVAAAVCGPDGCGPRSAPCSGMVRTCGRRRAPGRRGLYPGSAPAGPQRRSAVHGPRDAKQEERTGVRFSAQPVLWVSSLPKTTSTRSSPGVWRFRRDCIHLFALFQLPQHVYQMVVTHAAALAPQYFPRRKNMSVGTDMML